MKKVKSSTASVSSIRFFVSNSPVFLWQLCTLDTSQTFNAVSQEENVGEAQQQQHASIFTSFAS